LETEANKKAKGTKEGEDDDGGNDAKGDIEYCALSEFAIEEIVLVGLLNVPSPQVVDEEKGDDSEDEE
jgi:hypothetical protein